MSFLPKEIECGCYQCQALKKHNPFHKATLTQGQESNIHCTLIPCLGAAKDQKALNIDSAKAMPAQKFPAIVNRELGHDHDAHIFGAGASLTHQSQDCTERPPRGEDIIHH